MSAHVRFLSWIREGLASAGAGEDVIDAPLPDRGEVTLTVNLTPAGSADLKVRLLGPGDVTGIDPRQVIRTEPRAWTTDFEPNYFAAIELDRPELPWLFTPAKEEAERGRLRPWMALVVVPEDAPGVELDTHPRNPLPVLTAPRGELPDPAEGWAWAHAQLTLTSASEDPATVFAKHPDRTLARIVCPRRLEPDRMYLACLVPAFEAGRRAGLGLDPALTPVPDPGREPGDYAWSRTPEDAPCDPLPVYYHWRFGTSPAGDFESLVRRLDRVALPAGTGLRPMDVSRPEGGMPEDLPAAVLGMEGALRAPTTLPTPWDEAAREPFQEGLAEVLAPAGERLTPPVYGAVHAGVEGLPPEADGRFRWLRELNLDPRHRAAAALGARVVQENQEALLAAAWKEAAEVRRANQVLRQGELARATQASVYDRRVSGPAAAAALRAGKKMTARAMAAEESPLEAGRLLQLGSPALALVDADGGSVSDALAERPAAAASVSAAFRRIARPFGPVARRLAPVPPRNAPPPAPQPLGDPVLALAEGELAPSPALRLPPGMVALDEVSSRLKLGGVTPTRVGKAPAWWAATSAEVAPSPPPVSAESCPGEGAPMAVGDGRHVFMVARNRQLYELFWDGTRFTWHHHGVPEGRLLGWTRPAPFLAERRVFLTTDDGGLVERWWDGDRWQWRDHGTPPGDKVMNPGAVLRDGIFMGSYSGRLWERRRETSTWRWYDHGRPPGRNPNTGAVMESHAFARPMALGATRLLEVTNNGNVAERTWNGSWWSWTDRGLPAAWTPAPNPQFVTGFLFGSGVPIRAEKAFFGGAALWELFYPAGGGAPVWRYHGTPTDGSSLYVSPSAGSEVITIDEGVLMTFRHTGAGGVTKEYLGARSWMRYGSGAWGWDRRVPEIPGGGTGHGPVPVPGAGVVVVDYNGDVHLYRKRSWDYEWVPLGIPGDTRGRGNPAAPPEANKQRWAPRLGFMSTLLAAHVDNPGGDNSIWSRAGRDLDFDARPMGGWTDRRRVAPEGIGVETQGLGIAVGRINSGDRPDLVMLYVNNPPGANELWYRVGWELDAEGNASSWDVPRRVPLPVSDEVAEADITLADLDGDGRPELIIAYATRGAGPQRVFYRIGWRIGVSGDVEGGWSESVEVPGPKEVIHGVGVAVVDLNDNDIPDILVFTLDAEAGGSVGRYRIGRGINARGHVTGGWSGVLTVKGDPFPANHHGAGIAIADFSGSRRPDLVVFTVENGPTDNFGWVRLGRDLDKRGNARTWSEPRRIPGWFGWENQGAAITVADLDPELAQKREAMGTAFNRAAARHQDRVLDAQWAARREDPPAPVAADALAEQARAQMEPFAAVTRRVSARVELDDEWRGAADAMRPLLAAPEFPQPMYEALRDLGQEHLFPGWDTVPPETVTLLRTSAAFVEAFMVGMNHEMARELLWREFPTDRRATFFRRFWDARGAASGAELPPIEEWGEDRTLGGSPADAESGDMLVLAIRGEVLRRYPTASIHARRARWENGRRVPTGEVRLPQFRGRMEPDLLFFGMPLTVPQALGDDTDAGWFFVLQQQPTEPRFGLDAVPAVETYGGTPAAWNGLHWGHLAADRRGLEALVHVPVEASRLSGVRLPLRPDLPVDEVRNPRWGWNAAHLASITFQPPVQVAIHASDLIPLPSAEWRVTGVIPAPGPERRVAVLGGPRPEGGNWRLSAAEVVAALDRGEVFSIETPGGDRVTLVAHRTAAGHRYVKSAADGDEPNSLLALPRLPEEG